MNNDQAALPPPEIARKLAREGGAAIDGARTAIRADAESELHRLISNHPKSQVTAATSLTAALHTSGEALHTIAHLIGHPDAPRHDAAVGALARQALLGIYTVFYVLAPVDPAVRLERAHILANAENNSYMQSLKQARNYRGHEMRSMRAASAETVPKLEAERESYGFKWKAPDAARSIIEKASTEYAEILQIVLDKELVNDEDARAKLSDNVPAVASWSWQTLSGVSHCYGWPWELLDAGEVEGSLPQIVLAAEFSTNLVVGAATNQPGIYQSLLISSRQPAA